MLSQICNIIFAKYPALTAIYLYGSRAKGTHHENSDYDICVLMPTSNDLRRYDLDLNDELELKLEKEIHVVFCSEINEWCHTLIYPLNINQ